MGIRRRTALCSARRIRYARGFHAFIDAAHGLGLSVVLDIVLNHFGPEGNYLPLLSPAFFDAERMTPWGNGIAYEREPVRHYITDAPLYWLTEYRLDGLRFDAIDQIKDELEDAYSPGNCREDPRGDPEPSCSPDHGRQPQRHFPASAR